MKTWGLISVPRSPQITEDADFFRSSRSYSKPDELPFFFRVRSKLGDTPWAFAASSNSIDVRVADEPYSIRHPHAGAAGLTGRCEPLDL